MLLLYIYTTTSKQRSSFTSDTPNPITSKLLNFRYAYSYCRLKLFDNGLNSSLHSSSSLKSLKLHWIIIIFSHAPTTQLYNNIEVSKLLYFGYSKFYCWLTFNNNIEAPWHSSSSLLRVHTFTQGQHPTMTRLNLLLVHCTVVLLYHLQSNIAW